MSVVRVWRLFAYMIDDESGDSDHRRALADWQIEDEVRRCVSRGFDMIILDRDPSATAQWPTRPGGADGNQEGTAA